MTRKARPRTTCRERILPPEKVGEVITTKPAAVALWNTVLFDEDWYLDDYLPDYPDRIGLIAAQAEPSLRPPRPIYVRAPDAVPMKPRNDG